MNKFVPLSTYRLQLHRNFDFRSATKVLDYLKDLGVNAIYTSPIFLAPEESTHGYDQCDPQVINPNLGGEDGFIQLCTEAQKRGLAVIVDFVPNHMSTSCGNRYWMELLRDGPASRFGKVFDISWDIATWIPKVTVPILGKLYGKVLEDGEFKIKLEGEEYKITYFEHSFPVNRDGYTYLQTLRKQHVLDYLNSAEGRESLHALLELQHYRLRHWHEGSKELNYRRFFAINSLIGVNIEEPEVREFMHGKLKELGENGYVSGVRVDHIDGLADPKTYLQELRKLSPFVVVEKILSGGEELPASWPVDGTTGYEFATAAIRLFTEAEGEITSAYRKFTCENRTFEEIMQASKRQALHELFPSELDRFAAMLHRIAVSQCEYSDLARRTCKKALENFIVHLPVYRTYIQQEVSNEDKKIIEETVARASGGVGEPEKSALDLVRKLLLLEFPEISPEENEPDLLDMPEQFRTKLQQFTGAATAKGIEDTAFYIYNRLNCLNDVGAQPDVFSITTAEFHQRMKRQAETFPHTLLATSTHDSKVSEDVRCRLAAISHFAKEWAELLDEVPPVDVPTRNDQYLCYQMLIGIWPLNGQFTDALKSRLAQYMLKAVREAATRTRWTSPNAEYEKAIQQYVQNVCSNHVLLQRISSFAEKIAERGAMISLQQTILKLTVPGIPDIYQGNETWDFSLVDPDNRRAVDYNLRQQLIDKAKESRFEEMLENWKDGRIKLFLTRTLLEFRNVNPELFLYGSYSSIEAGSALAFKREHAGKHLLAYVKAENEIPQAKGMRKLIGGGSLPFGVFYR